MSGGSHMTPIGSIAQKFEPLPALVGALMDSAATTATLREQCERARTEIERRLDDITSAYFQILRSGMTADEMQTAAEELANGERAYAELVEPIIESLRHKFSSPREDDIDRALHQTRRDGIYILSRSVYLYRNVIAALLKLAAERRGVPTEVLRARPVQGEIDHVALIREHINRYPGIIAALAK